MPDLKRTVDRRILKSKAAIHEAFFELIKEQDYDSITITELARAAHVDRKTFYSHYRTLDDVLDEVAQDMVESIAAQIDFTHFFDDAEKNASLFFSLINKSLEERGVVNAGLIQMVPLAKILQSWARTMGASTKLAQGVKMVKEGYPATLVSEFYIGGLISLYGAWIADGCEITLDELAEIAAENALYGMAGTRQRHLEQARR